MSRRRRVLAAVLMLALTTALIPAHADTANVIEVAHSPDVPESGQDVNITMKVDNATNITSVKIIYCTIEPFKCEFPVEMVQDLTDETEFKYTIIKEYAPGTKIGFKFKIYFNDTTVQDFPESTADSNIHPVEGPFEGFLYFTFTLKSKPVDTGFLTWMVIIIIIVAIIPLIAAILLWTKKRKGRKDEGEK